MSSVLLKDMLDPKHNNFTLLRVVAALAVVVSHAVFLKTGKKVDEIFAGASVYVLGDHAVNVFFVLSGLTVAASLDRSRDIVLVPFSGRFEGSNLETVFNKLFSTGEGGAD